MDKGKAITPDNPFEADAVFTENCFKYGLAQAAISRKYGTSIKVDNWRYWLSLNSWTREEAACLFYEINPHKLPNDRPIAEAIRNLHEALNDFYRLAIDKGDIPMSSYHWKLFAMEHQLFIPKPIMEIEQPTQEIENQIAPAESKTEAVGDDNVSKQKPSTAKEVFECLKLMVRDPNKLNTLLFKNAHKTKWLSECKLGDGYNLPMVIKAHSKKGLLTEEYQKKFSEHALEKTLSVNSP